MNVISVGAGIIIFVFSLVVYFKIYFLSHEKWFPLRWFALGAMIAFFLIGYMVFEYFLVTGKEIFDLHSVIAQVFLWGSLFVLYCAWIFHEVIKEKEAARKALAEANEKLKELDRMKSNFLSNISHELRTPLSMIKGFAATILHEKDIDPKNLREFLQIIEEESERLNRLINRLLNLSRMEIGKIRANKKEFDLAAAARQVMEGYKTQLAVKELILKSDLPKSVIVNADQQGFKEVLSHLLENSIQYTRTRGKIEVSVLDKGDEVLVSVSDTGCGIPKDELPHIFERFYKVEHPAEQVGGVGMGLAIVKSIVNAHGGEMSVESEPEKGSRFSFTLPKT